MIRMFFTIFMMTSLVFTPLFPNFSKKVFGKTGSFYKMAQATMKNVLSPRPFSNSTQTLSYKKNLREINLTKIELRQQMNTNGITSELLKKYAKLNADTMPFHLTSLSDAIARNILILKTKSSELNDEDLKKHQELFERQAIRLYEYLNQSDEKTLKSFKKIIKEDREKASRLLHKGSDVDNRELEQHLVACFTLDFSKMSYDQSVKDYEDKVMALYTHNIY